MPKNTPATVSVAMESQLASTAPDRRYGTSTSNTPLWWYVGSASGLWMGCTGGILLYYYIALGVCAPFLSGKFELIYLRDILHMSSNPVIRVACLLFGTNE